MSRGLIATVRRLVERVVSDPFADAISCGTCAAWIPGGCWGQHVDWHRAYAERTARKIRSDGTE